MMKKSTLVLCSAALLLAACGGGSGTPVADTPPVTDEVPDSANASAADMVAWMTVLAGSSAETKEPLDVSKFAPPEPDDAEPVSLN
jgi:ABC-type glycerol-3-phosphate transport system substrate-binding protein